MKRYPRKKISHAEYSIQWSSVLERKCKNIYTMTQKAGIETQKEQMQMWTEYDLCYARIED